MSQISNALQQLTISPTADKLETVDRIQALLEEACYTVFERNDQKPWGAYLRLENDQAAAFIEDFFPGLTLEEAQLGMSGAELSPKILVVSPKQRLSWQYHDRRAERWTFLTEGGYCKSASDDEGELIVARQGDVVQFAKGE